MTNPTTKTDNPKSKALLLLENVLLVCCVAVIALRATSAEAPMPQSTQIHTSINDTVYSLALSGILIFALLLWVLARLFAGRLSFRITAMQVGLVILIAAAILATIYASNKRAAVNASIMLLAPFFMTMLLARLLDSHAKIRILLIVIIALGLVASWQSADQFFISNNIMLQQFQDDPNSILQPLGIRPGTLNYMMLEHRIYSKDVRAFFTTSNSAGSFAILTSFASIALFAELLKNRKTSPLPLANLLLAVSILAAVLFGLFITRSKGAIASFLLAAVIFLLLSLSKRPKLSKNIILAGCIFAILVSIPLIVWFGLKFGRLPGGNSMLVRWQYWHASAQMFIDHPLTGAGPGNFATLYHRYKPPSAIETVSDPHSLLLSILTQYGPLGLLGFLLIVLIPLWRSSLTGPNLDKPSGSQFKKLAVPCVIAPVTVMLLLRPFIIPPGTAANLDEKFYVLLTDYVVPAATFAVGFILLIRVLQTSGNKEGYSLQTTSLTAIALFCALLGVLIHNLIDFAIFEPGILTAFAAVLACLIALGKGENEQALRPPSSLVLRSAFNVGCSKFRLLPSAFCLLSSAFCLFCYFNYALLPVAKSTAKITQARRPIELGRFELAHNLLDSATDDDPLSPEAPAMNGRLYLRHFQSTAAKNAQILNAAEQALSLAAQRNPDDYKNFESLAEVYSLHSQLQPDEKNQWLTKALDSASIAVGLYPGDAELHFYIAQLADQLGKTDTALKHYQKAVQIEDSFRDQFHLMYPDREVLSRMPEEQYLLAKKRIRELLANPPKR